MSDGVRKVANDVRNVLDDIRKVSEGVRWCHASVFIALLLEGL